MVPANLTLLHPFACNFLRPPLVCIYIHTSHTAHVFSAFRPSRIQAIATRFELDPEAVLENVTYVRVHTSDRQSEVMLEACALLTEDQYKLIIVDSATALYRVRYSSRTCATAAAPRSACLTIATQLLCTVYAHTHARARTRAHAPRCRASTYIYISMQPARYHDIVHIQMCLLCTSKYRSSCIALQIYHCTLDTSLSDRSHLFVLQATGSVHLQCAHTVPGSDKGAGDTMHDTPRDRLTTRAAVSSLIASR